RVRRVNLANVLARRDEGYYDKLRAAAAEEAAHPSEPRSIHDLTKVKEAGLENLLVVDRTLKLGLLDHFLPRGTTLGAFASARADEAGDFAGTPYRVVRADGGVVELLREGSAYGRRTVVLKRIEVAGTRIIASW